MTLVQYQDNGPSEPLKAAVLAALMLGQPAVQIAHQFGLPPQSVKQWEVAYDISNPNRRRAKLDEMLLIFVEQEIASLMAISIATSDEEWILEQNAVDLSTFIATKQDRLMKVLEAFGRSQANAPRQDEIVYDATYTHS
jgi:hypothetical protein